MMTVKEVSELANVSVRTLHHYDDIGLLKPVETTDAGYRLYNEESLERLQTILLFRELRFPLKQIADIIDNPSFDRKEALSQQVHMLELEHSRLGRIIAHAKSLMKKEGAIMDFKAYDDTELEEWKAEAKERWGNTEAYREFECRAKQHDDAAGADALMEVFAELGALRDEEPESEAVQQKVAEIQQFITDKYYTCTDEIFANLGEMYAADERFRKNIDAAGGEGTADLARDAIRVFCS